MGRKYVYHLDTKNISFLQTARDLKVLGIKNNMFFLRLYDESLRHVDPYSPFLPQETIIRIINESIINPWYFLREVVRIPEQAGDGIPYQLNRANLAATFCFINGIDHYQVIPRQLGKTQSTIAILDWAFLLGTTNSQFMFINIKQDQANENLQRLKSQRDILPSYLQFKLALTEEGKIEKSRDNVTLLENKSNGNSIITKPSASSKEKAENIGRGCTQPIQYYDEVEFTDYIKDIVEAAGPAFNTASDNAKRNNGAYCRVFTSTPGDLDTRSCQQALEIINMTTKWSEKFYDWHIDDVKDYIAANSGNRIVYIEYQYQQLGKDEAWFRKLCGILNNEPAKIKREIFLQRMRGSSESPFEPEELEALGELRGKIKEEIFINKLFKLDVYESLKRDRVYLVGVDVATGTGGDNSAVTIVDPYTLKVVATFKSSLIGVHGLQQFLYVLVRKYIPKAILCIERNHNGEAVMDNLRQTEIRLNIYFDNSKDMLGSRLDDKVDAQGFLRQEAARRRFYGVYTSGKSREIMINLLYSHMRDFKEKFISNDVIDDIFALIINKRGKVEASPGKHDDCIMSYLIALYVYYHGNNLSRYGFVKGELPDEESRNKGLSYEETYARLDETTQQYFSNSGTKTVEDYTMSITHEIEKARREMSMFDTGSVYTTSVENLDEFNDSASFNFDTDFYSMLND